MNSAISEQQQALHAKVAHARDTVAGLEAQVRDINAELDRMGAQRQQYALLGTICDALGELDKLGSGELFWGRQEPANQAAHMARVRATVAGFEKQIAAVEQGRDRLNNQIRQHLTTIDLLDDGIARLRDQEERRKYEFVVERDYVAPEYRPMVMPWSSQAEDEGRFRRVLLVTLLLLIGQYTLVSLWTLTPPATTEVVEIPERLARLVKKEPPKPPEKKEERKPEEKKEDNKPEEKPKPTPVEKQEARKKAESSGLLAFKNNFTDLMELSSDPMLGVDARIKDSGKKVGDDSAKRSLITAQASSGSGGISTASLSRNVGGGGNSMGGVGFSRVESSIGTTATADANRPLSSGAGPSRTDEEIQIVFDRYKAALYRIYNRELRNDPTLRGKMVLRITIEPSGEVSACKVESTDLGSPTLVAEIAERVKKFNFGPKDKVPRVTILYPIDFLPAS